MAKRLSDAQQIIQASAGKARAARLPASELRRIIVKSEGILLPDEPVERRRLLRSIAAISNNLKAHEAFEDFVSLLGTDSDYIAISCCFSTLQRRMNEIMDMVKLAQRSSSPAAYLRFLSRKGFDLEAFRSSISVYSNGRSVIFEEVPEEKRVEGQEMIYLVKERSAKSLHKLIRILARETGVNGHSLIHPNFYDLAVGMWKERDMVKGVLKSDFPKLYRRLEKHRAKTEAETKRLRDAGIEWAEHDWSVEDCTGIADIFLLSYGIYVYRDEPLFFQRMFHAGALNGYVLTDAEFFKRKRAGGIATWRDFLLPPDVRGSVVQHELQHLFDYLINQPANEYTASLAQIGFSQNPEETSFHFSRWLHRRMWWIIYKSNDSEHPSHEKVERRIVHEVFRLTGSLRPSPDTISRVARQLLNDSYKKEVGLTYDEILEPFRKQP